MARVKAALGDEGPYREFLGMLKAFRSWQLDRNQQRQLQRAEGQPSPYLQQLFVVGEEDACEDDLAVANLPTTADGRSSHHGRGAQQAAVLVGQ
jgi:hypothetical protein